MFPQVHAPTTPPSIVAGQGWVVGPNGKMILTASAPTIKFNSPWQSLTDCRALQPFSKVNVATEPDQARVNFGSGISVTAEVVLQKLFEDRKLPGEGIDYAATPKIWCMNLTRSSTVPFSTI